jgi:AcrR family transcriptional regulator
MTTEPLEPPSSKRGPGGRPTRQEAERRHHCLLATATRLFLDKGWDGASVDAIAKDSGIAKRFIYARYPDKAALFVDVLERLIEEQIEALDFCEPLPADVEEGLYLLGKRLVDLALRPEVLAFHRLFIAEAPRFPELAKLFVERNRFRCLGEIIHVLAAYSDRGIIHCNDPELLAEQFFILVVGIPQRMALLLGHEELLQKDRRLKGAVRLFLEGCRNRRDPPLAGVAPS